MIKFIKNLFKPKIWGFEAADPGGKRGKCYTLVAGKLFPMYPIGMMYERDKDGNPTKNFDKVIISENKEHSIESYRKK